MLALSLLLLVMTRDEVPAMSVCPRQAVSSQRDAPKRISSPMGEVVPHGGRKGVSRIRGRWAGYRLAPNTMKKGLSIPLFRHRG